MGGRVPYAGGVPFTLSHPAAVIPLARGRLVPSALVVGSMVPDVPYLFSIGAFRGTTHRPLGIVTIDLVLGMVLFAAFHLLWKRPLVALAPPWLRTRMARPAAAFEWRISVARVPFSILVGILTHVLWDAFTHRYHGFADVLPWLVTTSVAGLELFRWLQYASGLIGGAVVVLWTLRWLRAAEVVEEEQVPGLSRRGAWTVWGCLAGAVGIGGAVGAVTLFNQAPSTPWNLHAGMASGAVSSIGGALLVLTAYSLVWLVMPSRRSASVPPAEQRTEAVG
ncbi:DUF4184 family protein [Actinomadura miaoliensis]|uniref:DUF4184 family protein n=1 Tax=Actinomadura miaoliensis TaxID=430685 RepID=A0ABP7WBB2_9ACTN